MIKDITNAQKCRFREIASAHSSFEVRGGDFCGIGTYNEKRLHRIIKEFVCSDENCFEVSVGGAVADVFKDGIITEIQTGGFYPLKKKIASYLANTDCKIRIIYPIISERLIVRVDPVTGDLLRARRSSAKQKPSKILGELIYLAEFLDFDRLSFEVYSVSAEEHRYSDEIHRYRKSGKRDSELFPTSLEGIFTIEAASDLLALLPDALLCPSASFTAADFMKATGIKGRRAYLALGALCAAKVLSKEKCGNTAAIYRVEGAPSCTPQ